MQVEFEGKTYEFPDDASDDEIAAALDGASPAAEQPSVAKDMALAAPSGLVRGAAETAMFPATAARAGASGLEWLADKGDSAIRALIGAEPATEAETNFRHDLFDQLPAGKFLSAISAPQDAVRDVMHDNLYEAKTMPGKFVETGAEFMTPGAIPSKAARLAPNAIDKAARYGEDFVGNVVLPAVGSEGLGQMTEGTFLETPARILGALFGNAGTSVARAANAPESIVRRATPDMTDAEWQKAIALQNNQTGVRVTGPEAISQVKGGGAALPQVQRYVEGSVDGRNRMSPFFAERPGQVDTAVNDVLDLISPQTPDPFDLGRRVPAAAGEVVDQTRKDINKQTRPLYDSAETQTIPAAEFAAIQANPSFAAAVERLRADPELGPRYANLPDNAVGVVDAASKDMFSRGEAMANKANPLYGPEKGALNTGAAADARNTASRSSPEYAQAIAEQDVLRDNILGPLEQGPVGQVSRAKDTASAGNAILPKNPMVGAGPQAGDAVAKLSAQDPEAIAALVRQNLADRFQTAATETQTGSKEFSGAKFHKDVAGNEARQETLDAVLSALPGGPSQKAAEVLEILETTGRRYPQNSATSFNDAIADDIAAMNGRGQAASAFTSAGLSIPVRVADWARRTGHRRSVGNLADMFIAPDSVEQIRSAANRGIEINAGEALIRSLLQSGVIAGNQ